MTKSNLAEKPAEKPAETAENVVEMPRKAPLIDPANIKVDTDGQVTRSLVVHLPEHFRADDLKEPDVWKRVQTTSNSPLRQLDRLLLIAWDQSWFAECRVTAAGPTSATLGKPVGGILEFQSRRGSYFHDETYRVIWCGTGFAVERKKDNHRMTAIVANERLAERDLANLYLKKAG